jgi:hypothetical protein
METPATKLGVDNEVLDPSQSLDTFASVRKKIATGERLLDMAWLRCSVSDTLCVVYYLRAERQETRQWAIEAVAGVEYYLFGDWREKAITDEGGVDPDWWFAQSISWTDQLCDGLCWGAVFGLWESIDKLMAFPTEKIGKDLEGAVPRAFYIGLARWWADHEDVSWIDDVKDMRGAGSKDYHMRCDVLNAISAQDVSLVSKTFTEYLQFWVKRIKDCPQRLPKGAAFLYHVAQREGMVIDLPNELSMHVPIVSAED